MYEEFLLMRISSKTASGILLTSLRQDAGQVLGSVLREIIILPAEGEFLELMANMACPQVSRSLDNNEIYI